MPTFHFSVGSPFTGWDSLAEKVQCADSGHSAVLDRTGFALEQCSPPVFGTAGYQLKLYGKHPANP